MITEEITNKIKRYLPMKVGTNLYVNEMKEVSGTNKIEVSIGISVPRIIYDDHIMKQYIKFVKFDHLYMVEFEVGKDNNVSAVINPEVIYDRFFQRQIRIITNVENLILDQIYPKLIRISLIKDNLRIIYIILNTISTKKKITSEDIAKFPKKKERVMKYLSFLEQYGIIRKNSEDDYVEGNVPIELQRALENKDEMEVLEYTFGYVLKDGRKYLKDELNLHMLDTFIEIATTYYYLSAKVGKLISINDDTFLQEFRQIYDRDINPNKFLGYLTELQITKVLNKSGNIYSGDNSMLNRIQTALI